MTEEERKREAELRKQDRIKARRDEREKIKGLGAGARARYFWDYYKFVLVIAAAVIVIIYIIITAVRGARTESLLYVCFTNVSGLDTQEDILLSDFKESIGGINENRQQITFDSSLYIDPYSSGTSQMDVVSSIKITTLVQSGMMDAMLAPGDVTVLEQEQGMLLGLDSLLDGNLTEELSEKGFLYYDAPPDEYESGPDIPSEEGDETETETEFYQVKTQPDTGDMIYAVRVDQAGVLERYDIYDGDDPIWFSVTGNTEHQEMAMKLLLFLLGKQGGTE